MSKHSNLKKVLSAVLALMMVLGTLVVVPMTASAAEPTVEAWDGTTYDDSWLAADGSSEDPYVITTGAQLATWSAITNGKYASSYVTGTDAQKVAFFNNKYIVLGADINMGGKGMMPIVAGFVNGSNWYDAYGSGLNFNGNGNTIYNLNVNTYSPALEGGPAAYTPGGTGTAVGMGLFGALGADSTISNLKFVGCTVSGTENDWRSAGMLAAYCSTDNVTIENITVDSTSQINGYRITGGLLGYISDTSTDKGDIALNIRNCVVAAGIKATGARCGGIVGSNISNYTMNLENCIFAGTFTLTANATGGVDLGGMHGATMSCSVKMNFTDCVNLGTFKSTVNKTWNIDDINASAVGGKSVITVTNCYGMADLSGITAGTIAHGFTEDNTATVTNSYGVGTKNHALPASGTFTVDERVTTLPAEVKRIQAELTVATGYAFDDFLDGRVWDGVSCDYSWFVNATDNNYEISNPAELAAWSAMTNNTHGISLGDGKLVAGQIPDFTNATVTLTKDIDMGGKAILPIRNGIAEGAAWLADYEEGLTFDGGNHTIYNLKISATSKSVTIGGKTSTNVSYGLFSTIGAYATVKNLHFVGANVSGSTGWNYTGVLAGVVSAEGVTIDNITVDDTTTLGNSRMIGVIGAIMDSDTTATAATNISNVVSAATENTAGGRAAGIVGFIQAYVSAINLNNCVFSGKMNFVSDTVGINAGGMVGSCLDGDAAVVLTNCVNVGTFKTTVANESREIVVSGTVAYMNKAGAISVTNCYDNSYRVLRTSNPGVVNTGVAPATINTNTVTLSMDDASAAVAPSSATSAFTAVKRNGDWSSKEKAEDNVVSDYAEIKVAVEAILKNITGNDVKLTITTESQNLSLRMKLTDPFGFMAITSVTKSDGTAWTMSAVKDTFADYGFAMVASDTAITARELYENYKIAAEAYDANRFCAAYTDLSAYELGETIYFAAYAVDEMGVVYLSEVRSIVVADAIQTLIDAMTDDAGNPNESLSASEKAEVEVYKAMLVYYNKYVAYFEELKNA